MLLVCNGLLNAGVVMDVHKTFVCGHGKANPKHHSSLQGGGGLCSNTVSLSPEIRFTNVFNPPICLT